MHEVYINNSLMDVLVLPSGLTTDLTGYEPIGSYTHPTGDNLGYPINHVLWHHARDIMYLAKYEDPSIYTINLVTDGTQIIPLVPGPLERIVKSGIADYSEMFELASPDVHFVIVARTLTPSPFITVTHGGEPLTIVQLMGTADTFMAFAVGRGLTTERAELKIKIEGGEIGGGYFRINEMKDVREPLIGSQADYYDDNYGYAYLRDLQGGHVKVIAACNGPGAYAAGLMVYRNPSLEQLFNGRIVSGAQPEGWNTGWDDERWLINDVWALQEDGSMQQSRGNGGAYFGSRYQCGIGRNYAVVMDVIVPEGSSIMVQSLLPSGGYPGETLYGPINGTVEMVMWGEDLSDVRVYINGTGNIKNLKIYENADVLTFVYYDGGPTEAGGPQQQLSPRNAKGDEQIKMLAMELLGDNFA